MTTSTPSTPSTARLVVGVDLSTSAAPGADPVATALRAEDLGYDFVSASDHPVGSHPTYDTPTLLTWVAARTSRIGVATRVAGVPFRPPATLAKSAESLDRLSGGRLILGLGAGYSDDEIHALGLPPRTPRQKIDGLADAVRILRGVWSEPVFDHEGAITSVHGLTLEPKPARPIPIWLGTFGPRALAATGALADGWLPTLAHLTPDGLPTMLDRVRDAAVAAGRPPDAVRPVLNLGVRVDPGAAPADGWADGVVLGTAAEVAATLHRFVGLGFRGFNVQPQGADDADVAAQTELVAREVLPALRSAA